MAKEDLKREIQSLYQAADGGMGLAQLVDGICHTLQKHEDALRGITYSYRLCASDTGYSWGFSLRDGHFAETGEYDEADAVVTGTEENLLAIFRRQISPMSALLRGKIKLKGSKAALIRFSEFL